MAHQPSAAPLERARKIRLLLMDIDGVWTQGGLFYVPGPDGDMMEVKITDAHDGMGLRWFHAAGLQSGLISGRESPAIAHRARMLGVTYIYQNYLEKVPPYEEICRQAGAADEEVAYIGDDLPDVPLLRRVGLAVAVADARPEVKQHAHYTTAAPGGRGAIRETIELIMKSQGLWQAVLDKYGIGMQGRDEMNNLIRRG